MLSVIGVKTYETWKELEDAKLKYDDPWVCKEGILQSTSSNFKMNRTDERLIQVIETLGEESYGACANLEIVEIPDDIDYEIKDYDGQETIAETHRTW
jgi:hypothetical protein